MDKYFINGIQQVGVGTISYYETQKWMAEMLGMSTVILEDDTTAERMLRYTGNQPQKRHAGIVVNLQGGSGMEIWQYSKRKPVPPKDKAMIADLGIYMAKIKCRDIAAYYREVSLKWKKTTDLMVTPNNTATFYMEDLYGNLIQLVEDPSIYINRHRNAGGVAGACIGVSDMNRALQFYHDLLGYDQVIYDVEGQQADWAGLPGGNEAYRRVLLRQSHTPKSTFSELYGQHTLELVQALDRQPKKLFEGRYWGDPGYIQLCYDVTGMDALGRHCALHGHPFTIDSCPNGEQFDMGDASGRFTYIEDPDGTLIEFVETRKITISRRWGWYIDLSKRNVHKPLPKIVFRALR